MATKNTDIEKAVIALKKAQNEKAKGGQHSQGTPGTTGMQETQDAKLSTEEQEMQDDIDSMEGMRHPKHYFNKDVSEMIAEYVKALNAKKTGPYRKTIAHEPQPEMWKNLAYLFMESEFFSGSNGVLCSMPIYFYHYNNREYPIRSVEEAIATLRLDCIQILIKYTRGVYVVCAVDEKDESELIPELNQKDECLIFKTLEELINFATSKENIKECYTVLCSGSNEQLSPNCSVIPLRTLMSENKPMTAEQYVKEEFGKVLAERGQPSILAQTRPPASPDALDEESIQLAKAIALSKAGMPSEEDELQKAIELSCKLSSGNQAKPVAVFPQPGEAGYEQKKVREIENSDSESGQENSASRTAPQKPETRTAPAAVSGSPADQSCVQSLVQKPTNNAGASGVEVVTPALGVAETSGAPRVSAALGTATTAPSGQPIHWALQAAQLESGAVNGVDQRDKDKLGNDASAKRNNGEGHP